MLDYHFTNDLRFSNVYINMKSVANHIENGMWDHPEQTLEQAKNGWYPVYEFYFGLYEGAHNVELILNDKANYVLGEFIKKFQYPNPKSDLNGSYKKELDNKQLNAPLRTLIQLLVYGTIFEGNNSISKDIFKYYIISNDDVAKNNKAIGDLYQDIKGKTLENIDFYNIVSVSGGDADRFVSQLLGVIEPLTYIYFDNNQISLTMENVQGDDKGILFDIVNYNEFWSEPNEHDSKELIQSYKEYMQSTEKVFNSTNQSNISVNEKLITKDILENDSYQPTFSDELKKEYRQYIYFGAPGTGKSYQLNKDSKFFTEKKVERVTFHPNMTYGQFVGIFKPTPIGDEKITYRYIPGALMKQLVQALLHPDSAYLLIVEELNRANVAAVFGDIFQLLDRNQQSISEYSINISEDIQWYFDNVIYTNPKNEPYILNMKESIKNGLVFPSNLFIWTTMNSADQGVMPMDTAFKRRWEQKYFGIDKVYEESQLEFDTYKKVIVGKKQIVGNNDLNEEQKPSNGNNNYISWNDLRTFLNNRLTVLKVPEDKLMGPYFITRNVLQSSDENLTESFKTKVLMYLFEDAAKQKQKELFNLDPEEMRYSKLVDKFNAEGIAVFKDSDELKYKIK